MNKLSKIKISKELFIEYLETVGKIFENIEVEFLQMLDEDFFLVATMRYGWHRVIWQFVPKLGGSVKCGEWVVKDCKLTPAAQDMVDSCFIYNPYLSLQDTLINLLNCGAISYSGVKQEYYNAQGQWQYLIEKVNKRFNKAVAVSQWYKKGMESYTTQTTGISKEYWTSQWTGRQHITGDGFKSESTTVVPTEESCLLQYSYKDIPYLKYVDGIIEVTHIEFRHMIDTIEGNK